MVEDLDGSRSVARRKEGPHRTMLVIGWGLAVALSVSGCDQIQRWMGKTPTPKPSPVTTPEDASAEIPSRPLVPETTVLATVNTKRLGERDVALAIQDLRATVEALGQTWTPIPSENLPDRYDLHDLLDELILAELRSQDAVSYGVARNNLDVQSRFWHRYRNFFAQEWVAWKANQLSISDGEVEQFYNQNQLGFREPERVRLRQIVLPSEQQAKDALVKLLEGVNFETIAQQMSIRPEAAKGELVEQWVMRSVERAAFAAGDQTVRALEDSVLEQAAFAIDKVGGVSSYVKGADGNFHVFQLVERQPGRQRPLVDVMDTIRNYLRLQNITEESEKLRARAKIETFPERLKDVAQ